MKKYFRRSVFVVVLALMIIGIGQPRGRAALDKPAFDPNCLSLCQQLYSDCFFNASRKSEERQCLAGYRHCISHCK
jgi:hypothetical protein